MSGGKVINFRQLPNAAFATTEITGEGYRVLAAVQFFDRGGMNGRGCDATIGTLAEKALCDTRTVQRWLKILVSMRLMDVDIRIGRGKANIYRVVYDGEDTGIKGDSTDTYSTERVTENSLKGDSIEIIIEEKQRGYEDKDTEGYHKRIHSRERAPFLENGASFPPLSDMAQTALSAFPTDALKFIDDRGEINLCGFLSMMDRKARGETLSAAELASLLDVAEAVFENTENHSPGYGLAYRLIQSEHQTDDDAGRLGR